MKITLIILILTLFNLQFAYPQQDLEAMKKNMDILRNQIQEKQARERKLYRIRKASGGITFIGLLTATVGFGISAGAPNNAPWFITGSIGAGLATTFIFPWASSMTRRWRVETNIKWA